jgi:hypothetical protein
MRLETKSAKGAARTTVGSRTCFAPHSVLRVFFKSGLLSAAALTVAIFIGPAPAVAQWINYPTAGVPKTPSGLPNLGAPTPKTADGKPDLSGIWEAENTIQESNPTELAISAQFLNIGARLEGGLPYQAWAAELVKQRSAGMGKDYPHSHCMPPGVPEIDALPEWRKIVQTPGLLLMLQEFNASYRQIFTDGRPLPSDPQPSWNGYSTGHWEGDTLVVETTGFRDRSWIDVKGDPLTDAAKVTERFRRLNYGNMQIEVTVDDPKAYTKPWTVKLNQYIVLNTELLDYICLENEKDISHMVGK